MSKNHAAVLAILASMDVFPIGQILILLMLANGAPLLATKLLGEFWARPLDGGIVLGDGQPLFGATKTVRGVVVAILATAAGAPLVGLGAGTGALVAITAMGGDLVSSFLKRRIRLAPSSMALGLDQIPESLVPAIVVRHVLGLSPLDILLVAVGFFAGELALSRILYMLKIRDRPY